MYEELSNNNWVTTEKFNLMTQYVNSDFGITPDMASRFKGALLGLATADALGAPVEFRRRGTFPHIDQMFGGGKFRTNPGEWTDDTSMALCLADSLLRCDGFDANDQMHTYWKWASEGLFSSRKKPFGLGKATFAALSRHRKTGNAYAGSKHPKSAGNGCLMRLVPIPMFYFHDTDTIKQYAVDSAKTTHQAQECLDCTLIFATMLHRALSGESKLNILSPVITTATMSDAVMGINKGNYYTKQDDQIVGSGYVVESLEAALWCFYHTSSYKDAVIKAVNLGDDADTTAAICGQLAGAFYAVESIPSSWLNLIAKKELIEGFSEKLYHRATN